MPCRKSLHGLCCCAWLFLVQGSARLKSIRHIHEHNLVTYRSSVHIPRSPGFTDHSSASRVLRESIHCARWCDASRVYTIQWCDSFSFICDLATLYIYSVSQIELETSLHRGVGRAAYCKSYFASTVSTLVVHDVDRMIIRMHLEGCPSVPCMELAWSVLPRTSRCILVGHTTSIIDYLSL